VKANTIQKNAEILLVACRQIGLEVNTEKTKIMFLSHEENAGQNYSVKDRR
jgi:hypothetical protein